MNVSRDLLLLILSYTPEETDEQLLCVNRHFLTLVNDLLSLESFWKMRYITYFHDTSTAYEHLLPETINYYGWRKLYRRVKDFDLNKVGAFGTPYVGPTGNVFYSYDRTNERYAKIHTCPVLEVVLLQEAMTSEDKYVLFLLYVSFDLSLRYYIMINFEEANERINIKSLLGNISGPCQHYFADRDMLIFLREDGSVMYCDNRLNLSELPDVIISGTNNYGRGIWLVEAHNSTCIKRQKYILHVNTFSVTYEGGLETKFTWPRTSPAYFECLRREMERLSTK